MSDIVIDRQTAHEVSKALHFIKGVIDRGLKGNNTEFTPAYLKCFYLLGMRERKCKVKHLAIEITPHKCLGYAGTCPDYCVEGK